MPVRGTTQYRHAIIQKKVINHDQGGTYVMCAWDTCDKPGYEMHKCVEHQSSPSGGDVTFVFCTERHKQYFIHSIYRAGDLPSGFKKSIL